MQTKLKIVLCIIIIMVITIIIGCIYGEQESRQQINSVKMPKHDKIIVENLKTIDTETDKEGDAQAVRPVSLGEFKLTAYCPCEKCCGKWAYERPNGVVYGSIGEELKEDYSIAVDPSVIPYRTEVVINGNMYKAQDCGGAIKGNRIDVFFEDHNDALEFGVQYAEVFVKK